jgi:predicted KAP-like P-loop ATPase
VNNTAATCTQNLWGYSSAEDALRAFYDTLELTNGEERVHHTDIICHLTKIRDFVKKCKGGQFKITKVEKAEDCFDLVCETVSP